MCNYLFVECQYECVKSTCHMDFGNIIYSELHQAMCRKSNGSGGGPRVVRGNRGGDVTLPETNIAPENGGFQ